MAAAIRTSTFSSESLNPSILRACEIIEANLETSDQPTVLRKVQRAAVNICAAEAIPDAALPTKSKRLHDGLSDLEGSQKQRPSLKGDDVAIKLMLSAIRAAVKGMRENPVTFRTEKRSSSAIHISTHPLLGFSTMRGCEYHLPLYDGRPIHRFDYRPCLSKEPPPQQTGMVSLRDFDLGPLIVSEDEILHHPMDWILLEDQTMTITERTRDYNVVSVAPRITLQNLQTALTAHLLTPLIGIVHSYIARSYTYTSYEGYMRGDTVKDTDATSWTWGRDHWLFPHIPSPVTEATALTTLPYIRKEIDLYPNVRLGTRHGTWLIYTPDWVIAYVKYHSGRRGVIILSHPNMGRALTFRAYPDIRDSLFRLEPSFGPATGYIDVTTPLIDAHSLVNAYNQGTL